MNYKLFIGLTKEIIFNPVNAWETIGSKAKNTKAIRNSLLIPLGVLVSVSAFFGSYFFSDSELSVHYSVIVGIKTFFLVYITVYAGAFLLGEITYPLDLGKDFSVSLRIIIFSITPFLVCQILSRLFESLLFVNVLGFYGIYIFWTGMEKVLATPDYKKIPLVIATFVTTACVYIATDMIFTKLINTIYYAFFT